MDILLKVFTGVCVLILLYVIYRLQEWMIEQHIKVAGKVFFVIRPALWFFNKFLDLFEKLRMRIAKPHRRNFMSSFGGPLRLVFIILLAVGSVFMVRYLYGSMEDFDEFIIINMLVKAPSLFLFTLILPITEGFTPFAIENLVEMVLIAAITIAFFHTNRHLSFIVQLIYNLVFLIFFSILPFFIPTEVYMFPAALFGGIVDITAAITNFFSPMSFGLMGRLLTLICLILYIAILLLTLYIIIAVIAVAVRELVASFAFSLFPTAVCVTLILVLQNPVDKLPDIIQAILALVIIYGLSIYMDFKRAQAESENMPTAEPNYRPLIIRACLWIKNKLSKHKNA